MTMMQKLIEAAKYLLIGTAVGFSVGGCAHKIPRDLLQTPLQDLTDHNLLAAVGVNVTSLPERIYDKKLLPFVSEFVEDGRKRGFFVAKEMIDLLRQVKYVDLLSIGEAPGVMAACNRYFVYESTLSGQKKVKWLTIEVLEKESKEYTGSDPAKELILLRELMYHEIFHCLLGKGHLPEGVEGIMSSTFTKGNKRALEDWNGLVDEMFTPEYLQLIPDVPST